MITLRLLNLLRRAGSSATLTLAPPAEASLNHPLSRLLLGRLTRPLRGTACRTMLTLIDQVDGGAAYHAAILDQHRPVCGIDLAVLRRAHRAQRAAVRASSVTDRALAEWQAQRDAAYPPRERARERKALARAMKVWQARRDADQCRRLNGITGRPGV